MRNEIDFKSWFIEQMTSTACIASFARVSLPAVRRTSLDPITVGQSKTIVPNKGKKSKRKSS